MHSTSNPAPCNPYDNEGIFQRNNLKKTDLLRVLM